MGFGFDATSSMKKPNWIRLASYYRDRTMDLGERVCYSDWNGVHVIYAPEFEELTNYHSRHLIKGHPNWHQPVDMGVGQKFEDWVHAAYDVLEGEYNEREERFAGRGRIKKLNIQYMRVWVMNKLYNCWMHTNKHHKHLIELSWRYTLLFLPVDGSLDNRYIQEPIPKKKGVTIHDLVVWGVPVGGEGAGATNIYIHDPKNVPII